MILILLLAEVVNLCMAGSFYLTMILRALLSFPELLNFGLHLGELVPSLN